MLTQHGKEVNVPQHAIQLRKTRAVALDNKQNSITSKDVIRVIQGPHIVSLYHGIECLRMFNLDGTSVALISGGMVLAAMLF